MKVTTIDLLIEDQNEKNANMSVTNKTVTDYKESQKNSQVENHGGINSIKINTRKPADQGVDKADSQQVHFRNVVHK